jgi:hypothetical protein
MHQEKEAIRYAGHHYALEINSTIRIGIKTSLFIF